MIGLFKVSFSFGWVWNSLSTQSTPDGATLFYMRVVHAATPNLQRIMHIAAKYDQLAESIT